MLLFLSVGLATSDLCENAIAICQYCKPSGYFDHAAEYYDLLQSIIVSNENTIDKADNHR